LGFVQNQAISVRRNPAKFESATGSRKIPRIFSAVPGAKFSSAIQHLIRSAHTDVLGIASVVDGDTISIREHVRLQGIDPLEKHHPRTNRNGHLARKPAEWLRQRRRLLGLMDR
jgi:endonuclease YncB( thermonuclease family)